MCLHQIVCRINHPTPEILMTLQVSRDRMVSCSSDGNVRVWDFITPAPKTAKDGKDPVELIEPTVVHQAKLNRQKVSPTQ